LVGWFVPIWIRNRAGRFPTGAENINLVERNAGSEVGIRIDRDKPEQQKIRMGSTVLAAF
ncbi:MAG TPA: hypothetical protein PLM32_11175, partial [Candidatus Competibacter sp.]|nr:hypothetical protein [Candidatus Competibacter sp.]